MFRTRGQQGYPESKFPVEIEVATTIIGCDACMKEIEPGKEYGECNGNNFCKHCAEHLIYTWNHPTTGRFKA